MKRKWYGKLQETPLYSRISRINMDAFEQTASAEDGSNDLVDDPPDGEGAGDEECAEEQAPSKSKKEAMMKLASRRKRLCTLAFVLQLLCDDHKMRLWASLANLTHPLEKWYRLQWKAQRARDDASRHVVAMQGYEQSLEKVIAELFQWYTHPDFLSHMQVGPYGANMDTPASRCKDEKVMQVVLDFLVTLGGELAMTLLLMRSPPHSFLLLLSESDQQAQLMKLEAQWLALSKIECCRSDGDAVAASVLDCMLYPSMTWVRETFVRLEETCFKSVPPTLLEQLQCFAGTHMSTLVLENTFNDIRRINNKTRSRNMSAQQVWHAAMTSRVGPDVGRPHVQPGATPRTENVEFKHTVFESNAENVYSEDALDEMLTRNPSWQTPSPPKIKVSALMWHTMCACKGEPARLQDSWKNLLMTPGLLFLHESTPNQPYLVLSVHPEGVIAHRVKIEKVSNACHLPIVPDSICCFFAVNPREFRVGRLVPKVLDKTDERGRGAHLVFKKAGSLLAHSCREGFPNMSVSQLRCLGRFLELELGPRCTEETLIRALVKKILGLESDDAYTSAMRARCGAASTSASVIHPAVVSDGTEGDDDWEDAEVVQHIQEHRKHERARLQRAIQLIGMAAPPAAAATTTAESSSAPAASSASTSTVPTKSRLFNPLTESGLSEEAGRELAP
eukprot:1255358-Amphidinium_carterae.1